MKESTLNNLEGTISGLHTRKQLSSTFRLGTGLKLQIGWVERTHGYERAMLLLFCILLLLPLLLLFLPEKKHSASPYKHSLMVYLLHSSINLGKSSAFVPSTYLGQPMRDDFRGCSLFNHQNIQEQYIRHGSRQVQHIHTPGAPEYPT